MVHNAFLRRYHRKCCCKTMATTARLGRELIAYALAPPPAAEGASTSRTAASSLAPAHAALVALHHPNASSPVALLRGMSPRPSASSWTVMPSSDASSALVIHADAERPLIHAHTVSSSSSSSSTRSESASQTCQLAARLHPPEVTPTMAISPSGSMLAAGSGSGRLYIWHLPSGQLLASLDAHFRRVTCLEWTADERALVSASEDARILVWSVAALMQARSASAQSAALQAGTAMMTPFAVLADHVQAVTSIALSSSASSRSAIACFPASLRILSASRDGSVKMWDVRTRSLVATWTFQGQVTGLAADVGFRAFFTIVRGRAAIEQEAEGESTAKDSANTFSVCRVDLYGTNAQDPTTLSTSAAAMTQVSDRTIWQAAESTRITALRLSTAGSHLLIGTSHAQLIVLDVASSAIMRTISLLPAGLSSKGQSNVLEVAGLTTVIVDDPQSLLQGSATSVSRGQSVSPPYSWTLPEKLQRTPLTSSASSREALPMRLEERPIGQLTLAMTPPSLRARAAQGRQDGDNAIGPNTTDNTDELRKMQQRILDLEHDNERLSNLLKRAQTAHATLWDRVVQDAAKEPARAS